MARPVRPVGQPTRGKTAVNRLRRIDAWVALAMPGVLRGDAPLAVDVGYGARPWTTLEMAERWRRVEPSLRVLGVEIDPQRVEAALPFADPPATVFVRGGFDLAPVLGSQRARLIRAMNVLRQYEEAEVAAALARMAASLEPDGVLLEGTSDETGGMAVFDVWRPAASGALRHERLVFATSFRAGHEPADFRARLPKRLIHRALDTEPARFFDDWQRAWATARGRGLTGSREAWVAAAMLLRERGWPVDARKRLLERGYLALGTPLG
jgi:hypothetical protein